LFVAQNKSSEAEIEALREEFQQRLNATERKVNLSMDGLLMFM
jgi:hypothetical protein